MQDPRSLKPLIPAWADDAGWTAAEFRIYGHLCRRGGWKGQAYPSIKSISGKCRLHKDTVCKCLKQLESHGYVKRVRKHGRSNTYLLFTPAELFGARQLPLADSKGQPLSGTKGHGVVGTEGQKGIERKEYKEGGAGPAPEAVVPKSEAAWRKRLQAENPAIDIDAELKKATRKKPGFERDYFERNWLPKCTPVVGAIKPAQKQAINAQVYAASCDAGLAWIKELHPSSNFASWPEVPIDLRQRYAEKVAMSISLNKT